MASRADAGLSSLSQIKEDDVLNEFLSPTFDAASFTSRALSQSHDLQALSSKLDKGIEAVDQELKDEVISHHEDLLQQSGNISELDKLLATIRTNVKLLQTSIRKIHNSITEPVGKYRARALHYRRIHEASEILRRILRFFYVYRRFKTQLRGGLKELSKAAQSLFELETLLALPMLQGVEVIAAEAQYLSAVGKEVRNKGIHLLMDGLEKGSQAEVGTGILVFFNLSALPDHIEQVIAKLVKSVEVTISSALNLQSLLNESKPAKDGKSGPGTVSRSNAGPGVGGTAAWRNALWKRIENMFSVLNGYCTQVWLLQRVLAKKRDPQSLQPLSESVDGYDRLFTEFWIKVTDLLHRHFDGAANASTAVNQVLVNDFPKFLSQLDDFANNLQRRAVEGNGPANRGDESVEGKDEEGEGDEDEDLTERQMLMKSVKRFESAYLAGSFTRLSAPINALFSTSARNVQSGPLDIMPYLAVIQNELQAGRRDPKLLAQVSKKVASSIELFQSKCETAIMTGPDATQFSQTQPLTAAQKRNAALFNAMQQFRHSMLNLAGSLSSPYADAFTGPLERIEETMHDILRPLVDAWGKTLDQLVMNMHQEGYGGKVPNPVLVGENGQMAGSAYLRELQSELSHIQSKRLIKYTASEIVTYHQRRLISRVLVSFVRHASLIRPMTENGKLKLAGDMAQLEMMLGGMVPSLADLGHPYQALRALRPLLFMDLNEIARHSEDGQLKDLRPSTVLHHLYSRAPNELQQPHTSQGWTIARYHEWLERNDERQRWQLIQSTLQQYANLVNARGEKEFHPVYPVMTSIAPTLLARWDENSV